MKKTFLKFFFRGVLRPKNRKKFRFINILADFGDFWVFLGVLAVVVGSGWLLMRSNNFLTVIGVFLNV